MSIAIDWRAEAERITIRDQAFIGGKFVDALSGETFDCISPIDGRLLARVAACGPEDVDAAVRSARTAFENGVPSTCARLISSSAGAVVLSPMSHAGCG